jgi:hypothetical protein
VFCKEFLFQAVAYLVNQEKWSLRPFERIPSVTKQEQRIDMQERLPCLPQHFGDLPMHFE